MAPDDSGKGFRLLALGRREPSSVGIPARDDYFGSV